MDIKKWIYDKLKILYCPTHVKRLQRKGICNKNVGVRCPICAYYKSKLSRKWRKANERSLLLGLGREENC